MPPRLLVRAQPLGGLWTPLGTDVRRGIYVEDFQCSADAWGPADASFTLRRSARTTWPDLSFWTPLEVEVENQLVWSGRIIGTPGRDADEDVITVNAQGWQYHLDDRPYTKLYVLSSLSAWQDCRQAPDVQLAANEYGADGVVSAGANGAITLTSSINVPVALNRRIGVYIDLGPGNTATDISVDFVSSNNQGLETLHIRGQTTDFFGSGDSGHGPISDAATQVNNAAGSGTLSGSFGSGYRYISIFTVCTGATTPGADVWWKLTGIRIFGSGSYRSGAASILKASDVITDVFGRLPLVTISNIASTSFALPSFSISQQTPRDAALAANAFQDWQARVTEDRVLEYRARPTGAVLALTDQTAFDDLSAGSGDAIYNEVTYVGTGPDGTPVVVTRTSTAAGLPQTIPDRRGITKGYTIQSSAPLTSAAASQLCDVFLSQRNRTPFKGTVHATSRKSVAISGAPCPTYQLLRYPGELVTFKHLQDPDTGALGRDGRIAKVTYTHSSDSAEVDIDSVAGSFEALMSRLAVVTAR